ncbi:MAG TPA: hypothetical protein VF267_04025, partial [Gammaproteobacteria bacterium]
TIMSSMSVKPPCLLMRLSMMFSFLELSARHRMMASLSLLASGVPSGGVGSYFEQESSCMHKIVQNCATGTLLAKDSEGRAGFPA